MFGSYQQAIKIVKSKIRSRATQIENALEAGDDKLARRMMAGMAELYELSVILGEALRVEEEKFSETYMNKLDGVDIN